MDQEQQRYDRAHARVQALKGFYIHASAYVLVNIALFAINVLVGGGWWFYWPLLGWGIGLGVHALAVFGSAAADPGAGSGRSARPGSSWTETGDGSLYSPSCLEGVFSEVRKGINSAHYLLLA